MTALDVREKALQEDCEEVHDIKSQKTIKDVSFWSSIGNPKYILGPMVDQSDLPYRLLCRRYGVELAYTPMIHSRLFCEQQTYRQNNFQTSSLDEPVIAQFCGDDPHIIGQAAQILGNEVNAIDINLGCPQNIAKRGHYGSFLLEEPDKVESLVKEVVLQSPVPVTCKLRKIHQNDYQSTLNLVKRLEAVGCSALCLHGRTKEEKGQRCGPADWDIITKAKKILNIPVIANGGIESLADAQHCMKVTGVDAVMSAEAILEDASLFHSERIDIDRLMMEYLDLCKLYPTNMSTIKAHLFHSLYAGLQIHTDLRSQLGKSKSFKEFEAVASALREKRTEVSLEKKLGWYRRYARPIVPESSSSSSSIFPQTSILLKERDNPLLLTNEPLSKRPRLKANESVVLSS